ncbi:S-layer homology domain-containing protein, partial [Alkaliphilus sp. AH-315-G20]|nr:S-layer homology domain-containing protein [Alkaliphilus sp. AH-315-G20]
MKKLITIALVLLMILSTTTGAFALASTPRASRRAVGVDNFGNTPEFYHRIARGEAFRAFNPNFTDGRMQILMGRYNKIKPQDIETRLARFSDIGTHWGSQGIGTLAHLDILNGFPDGSFRPNDTLQLDQFLKMVLEGMGHQLELGFQEYWAINYVNMAFEEGLVRTENKGFSMSDEKLYWEGRVIREDVDVNVYDPTDHARFKQPITREEMAKIIVRAMLSRRFEDCPTGLEIIEREFIKDIRKASGDYFHYIRQAYSFGLLTGRSRGNFEPQAHLTRAEGSTVIMRFLDPNIREGIKPDLSSYKQV